MSNYNPISELILQQLTAAVGADQLSTAFAERQLRAQDMSQHEACLSDVVIWPATTQQVVAVMRIANNQRLPVTPWGAGSSLEGNPIPVFGGISLSMERMNAIIDVHEDDFQVTVQPGIGYKDLNDKLRPYGLFFPPDPGANASIGGMLANNAAGSRTVKYGATKDNVLAMEVVLADGRIIQVGAQSIKQASGYDLLHLFVGSEGTLGVITKATLKLTPVPSVMSGVVAVFPEVEPAVETVVAIRGSGLDVAALEFLGAKSAALISREDGVTWGERPTLMMEIHATHQETANLDLALIREICSEMGALEFEATTDSTAHKKMWQARHHFFETQVRVHPGHKWQLTDVAVPISAFPELITHVGEELVKHDIFGYLIGHAGDGNLHVSMPYQDEETRLKAAEIADSIVYCAIDLGGTSTGEHGVGIGKSKFMVREHGVAMDVMKSIKKSLDPNGILNPGKIFPVD